MSKKPTTAAEIGLAATAPSAAPEHLQKKAAERKVTQMEQPRFKGVEFMRSEYLCTAHPNTTPEDLLAPEYWAHISAQLRPRDRIEAWANDGSWMAEYVVLEAGRNWARLHLLQVYHFTSGDQAMTQADAMSPYEITFRGPHAKWSVVRKSDRQVVHEGAETARAAAEWLTGRMQAGV